MNKIREILDRHEPGPLKALRLIAIAEGISFVVLLVCSLLKRTTEFNAVPAMGGIHGALFLLYLALLVENWSRLGWKPFFALVMATVGSPGAHFAVDATKIRPDTGPRKAGLL